jgi:Protein of unknown function (DUF3987)
MVPKYPTREKERSPTETATIKQRRRERERSPAGAIQSTDGTEGSESSDVSLGIRSPLQNPVPDIAEIRRFLECIVAEGATVELRAPGTSWGVTAGLYEDIGKLAADAALLDGQCVGIYVTLNPVAPTRLPPLPRNRLGKATTTTGDAQINERNWGLIDLDPVRPAGVSATEAEHKAALSRGQVVYEYLLTTGFSTDSLVVADSGNGVHILIRLDLPNDDGSTSLAKRFLAALDLQFTDETVAIDTTTANAARITKIIGTVARKGESTPERPHRLSRILKMPERVTAASHTLIEEIVNIVPKSGRDSSTDAGYPQIQNSQFDIESFIRKSGLEVVKAKPWVGGWAWVLRVCPFNENHTNHSAVIIQHSSGAISFTCHHNGCREHKWSDLRSLLEPKSIGKNGDSSLDHPDVPTLSMDMVPQPIRPWIEDVCRRFCLPPDYFVPAFLVGLGSVIGSQVGLRPEEPTNCEWTVTANFYGALVVPPGGMKTPVVRAAMSPVTRLEALAYKEYLARRKQATIDLDGLKEAIESKSDALRGAQQEGVGAKVAALEGDLFRLTERVKYLEAPQRRYIAQDVTTPKLATLIEENSNGLLVLRDELVGLLATFEKPGGQGPEDRSFYLTGWDGLSPYKVDRVTRSSSYIPRLTLSLFGGIQPHKLKRYISDALTGGHGDDGLLQRLQLLTWPSENLPAYEKPRRRPDPDSKRAVHQLVERLSNLDLDAIGARRDQGDEHDDQVPYLTFSPQAQKVYDHWHEDLENRLRGGELAGTPSFKSHIDKYRSLVPELSQAFHLLNAADRLVRNEPIPHQVGPDPLELAIRWSNYLEGHARKVYAQELRANHVTPWPASPEREILGALLALASKVARGKLPVHLVTAHLNSGRAKSENVTPTWIGKKLNAMGLKTTRSGPKGESCLQWSDDAIRELGSEYGLRVVSEPSEPSEPSASLSPSAARATSHSQTLANSVRIRHGRALGGNHRIDSAPVTHAAANRVARDQSDVEWF